MHVLSLIAGALIIVVTFADAFATTLVVGAGGGPLTRRVMGWLWRLLLRIFRGGRAPALLGGAGAAILISTVMVWVALLWAGWSLILLGGHGAVVDARTGAAAGWTGVVYYAGFTIFTLGVGDYVAGGTPWRILTAVSTFTGLFLVTLAITYLVSVVAAVVGRRAVAVRIHALGRDAADIARRGWTGSGVSSAFVQHLVSLTGQLSVVAEQHLAYPALHYFRSRSVLVSAPIAVARLDDAMLLLSAALRPDVRPDDSVTSPVRAAVDRYVSTVAMTSAVPAEPPVPPLSDRAVLAGSGMPTVPEEVFRAEADAGAERRRALHRLVLGDGRGWDAVH
ncbi:potassium channel family protein [Couchioplanes caeruleus]|uniref:ion channel n=1 Tax=Couchioplanes caeruleus TaxID=56438 RepID=UPI0020BEB018|nr:ion channel [Couchioplanes caeruleus]UQU62632.1 potassium channel family protein [Couchioplanes caeruleus]